MIERHSFGGHLAAAKQGLAGVPAILKSGLLRPTGPIGLARMAGALWQWGPTPATLSAVSAARWPDHLAVADERGELTYAELDRRSAALANALAAEYDIDECDSLGLMCRNHRGFLEAAIAAGRLGADLLLLNTELPAGVLRQLVDRHRISVVVCDEEFAPAFDAADYAGPLVLAWLDGADQADRPERPTIDSLVESAAPNAPSPGSTGKVVILTSGTTGVPKGVPRTPSAGDALGVGMTAIARMSLHTKEAMLIAPPLFHGFGLAFLAMALAMGNTVVLRRKFDPEAVLALVERYQATTMLAVPVMLQRILALPAEVRERFDTSTLRVVFSGAAPLTPPLASRFTAAFGEVVYNGYGTSEVGVATIADPQDLAEAPGTVGRPVSGVDVRILDDAGKPVPEGEVGRIFVGSALTFQGYTGGGSQTVVDGLMSTGDLGHRDADGRIFVDGRADDMIVSGGENIFPHEVETALLTHDAVSDAAVVGVPDKEFGQRLRAFVVPHEGRHVTVDDLKEHLRGHVARYMVPREFVFVDDLPRNATGKVLRSKLR